MLGANLLRANNIWISSFIVFVASACTLIIELVAGRIMAPYVGVSLYTWTSIIGVVLAGISLGNYLGGQIADRWGSRRTLGVLLLLSGAFSLAILATMYFLSDVPFSLTLVPKILFLSFVIFFPPSCVLGTISPVVVKLTLENLSQTGNIVGKIYACSALGSIFGTFLTGFVLISWLGTRAIVFIVAIVLVLMAIVFGDWRRTKTGVAILLVFLAGFAASAYWMYQEGKLQSPYLAETNYFSIRVGETQMTDGSLRKELILDHLVHSYSWVDDPKRLEYGYEKVYAEVTNYVVQKHPDVKALFIGGGGYTFPRYVEASYRDSLIDVVEIDPGVTKTAYEQLGLRPDTKIRTINGDARMFFDGNGENGMKYDIVLGDAFNDLSLPYHLTTYEFNEKVKKVLAPDGFYLVNIIDNFKRGEFMPAYLRTLKMTFPYVYLIGLGTAWEWDNSSTYVVLGSNLPLDRNTFEKAASQNGANELTGVVMSDDRLKEYLSQGRQIVLTDDYVPVDNLMAPRFVERGF